MINPAEPHQLPAQHDDPSAVRDLHAAATILRSGDGAAPVYIAPELGPLLPWIASLAHDLGPSAAPQGHGASALDLQSLRSWITTHLDPYFAQVAGKSASDRTQMEVRQLLCAVQHAIVAVCKVATSKDPEVVMAHAPKAVTEEHLHGYSQLTPCASRVVSLGTIGTSSSFATMANAKQWVDLAVNDLLAPSAAAAAAAPTSRAARRQLASTSPQPADRIYQLNTCACHLLGLGYFANQLHPHALHVPEHDFARLQLYVHVPLAQPAPAPAPPASSAAAQLVTALGAIPHTSVTSVRDLLAHLDHRQVASLSPFLLQFFVAALNKSRNWRQAHGDTSHPARVIVLVDGEDMEGSAERVRGLELVPWLDVYVHGSERDYRHWASPTVGFSLVHTGAAAFGIMVRALLPENRAKLVSATAVVLVSTRNHVGALQVELARMGATVMRFKTWADFDVAVALLRVCVTGKDMEGDAEYVAPADASPLVK